MATASNTLPGYELTFITKNEISDNDYKKIGEKVSGIIKKFDGEIVAQDDWGKRKLAYPIKKETRGRYSYFVFTGKKGVVPEIERNFKMSEDILRFLSVKLAEEFDASQFKKKPSPFARKEGRDRDRDRDRDSFRDRDSYRDRDRFS